MGGFKFFLKYAAGFLAQRAAAALGYKQILLVLGETVAGEGAMNVFAVFGHPGSGESLSHIFILGFPFACDLHTSDLLIHPSLRS